ncbi:hypothetical protein R3P38DRAFT_3082807 [Favolaschia claudopus]|uniref:Uncharacterized protein n=1 Tax=Favolaschia claudopus TaxID=2862362 RepID=A0AAV9ZV09_9AGAR
MENWPVYSNEGQEALHEMRGRFRVVPLPAYDKPGGDIIPPSRYCAALKGAVVEVAVALTYWDIPPRADQGGRSAFAADIERLAVLSQETAPCLLKFVPSLRALHG